MERMDDVHVNFTYLMRRVLSNTREDIFLSRKFINLLIYSKIRW